MASIDSVKQAVDSAAAKHGFRCVNVSWEDAARSVGVPGGLSCGGPNISDVRLWERTGKMLFTVRSQNWNERLGYVSAADVAVMTGNEKRIAAALAPTTLDKYLQNIGTHGAYAGVEVPSLYEPTKDTVFGIRFQTVFLPVAETVSSPWGGAQGPPPATEFCTEVYNYQTRSDNDPKNLLLLATPQGLSVQQDERGRGKVFFHSVGSEGTVHRYWLEAEKSEKQVGGAQVESKEEALEAAKRGKATAVRIGPSSMGTRFNVQMLIQVPLKQRPPQQAQGGFGRGGGCAGGFGGGSGFGGGRGGRGGFGQAQPQSWGSSDGALDECFGFAAAPPASSCAAFGKAPAPASNGWGKAAPVAAPVGVSNAARVSRGTQQDTWAGVKNKRPERDPSQHGTITVTMYYTVVGGVPSAADVDRACRDLDALYKQCPSDKRLIDCTEVTVGPKTAFPPPPPPVTVAAPCFVPPPPSAAGMAKVTSLSSQSVVTCQAGHGLTAMRGGESFEPPNGWWCDGCGLFLPAGYTEAAAGAAKGYGCRSCDFDLCAGCAVGPRCPAGHGLVARRDLFDRINDTTPCSGCARPFANRAALLRGCPCVQSQASGFASTPSNMPAGYALCDQCFRIERAKRGLA